MPTVTLKAHYDGERILLDESYPLPPDACLLVTLIEPSPDLERQPWFDVAGQGLAAAYGDSEPNYGLTDLKTS